MNLIEFIGYYLLTKLIIVPLVIFFSLFVTSFVLALWAAIVWFIDKVGGIKS